MWDTQLNSLKKVSDGVFYSTEKIIFVCTNLIEFLKRDAINTSLLRSRLCAHPDPLADQHDMTIVTHHSSYVAPHRHKNKSETLLVLEGEMQLLVFSESGECILKKNMGSYESGDTFFYRMPTGTFHSMIVKSEWLVFQESTRGPFDILETDYPEWAPKPTELLKGKEFLAGF